MSLGDENANTDTRIDSKVARLIEEYGLGESFGERLEERWTTDGPNRESLRALADRFNKRLLEAAVTDAGISTIEGEIDNLYRLLTSDDVTRGTRTEARRSLEQGGVDIDRLERDFVTYQAIRTYLKEYRNAEYERTTEHSRIDSVIETLQRLQSRTHSVAEKSLEQLAKTDQLTIGEFRIFVDISVLCEGCNKQYGIVELLREGSCECQSSKGEERIGRR